MLFSAESLPKLSLQRLIPKVDPTELYLCPHYHSKFCGFLVVPHPKMEAEVQSAHMCTLLQLLAQSVSHCRCLTPAALF